MKIRSVFERRFRRDRADGREPLLGESGRPVLVVSTTGEALGYRAKDGGIIEPPPRPLSRVPDEEWGEVEYVLGPDRRLRPRWRT